MTTQVEISVASIERAAKIVQLSLQGVEQTEIAQRLGLTAT